MLKPYTFESIPFPSVEGNPRNGEGDAVELSDGRLLMVFGEFHGGSDDAPATLEAVISGDQGRTWRGKRTLQKNIGGKNVMSVSLLRLSNDDILLLFLKKDESASGCTPYLRRSRDEGKTWSAPKPAAPGSSTYYVVNNNRLVQLKSRRILIPAAMCEPGIDFVGDRIFFSDDQGRTWRCSAPHPFLPQSRSGAQEPGVIELRDGRVMMWCRCDLGEIYRCYSKDGGKTFGSWTPMGLKAPCAPATIRRIPSTGDLLCIFNNHATPPDYWAVGRSPLTAALSKDEGDTWRVVGDLEPNRARSYCYTSVTFLSNDDIFLTYYHGRDTQSVEEGRLVTHHYNLAHLKVAVFPTGWLYGKKESLEVAVPRLRTAPAIDGDFSKPVWKNVPELIVNRTIGDGTRATVCARARVARDASNLYIAVRCDEPRMADVRDTETRRRGPIWGENALEFFFDTDGVRRPYRHLGVNSLGTIHDTITDGRSTADWDSMARVATTRGRNFWTLEMVVPLSALSDRPVRKGDVWRFNIGRTRALPRPYESVCWAPTLSGFHERNKFGSLVMG